MKKVIVLGLVLALLFHVTAVPSQAASKKNWKSLYAKYLKKSGQAYTTGRFIYVNNDHIPELYLQGSSAAAGNRLLTIYKNKVYVYSIEGHGSLLYLPKKNRFYIFGGHMDSYYDYIGKLNKGKMIGIAGGSFGAVMNTNVKFDKKGNPIYRYYWCSKSTRKNAEEYFMNSKDNKNGKRVTQKQYNQKLRHSLGVSKKKYKSADKHVKTIRQIKKTLK